MQDVERESVATFCDQLPQLRVEVARRPDADRRLLARIEEHARAGLPIRALLAELLPVDESGPRRHLEPLPTLGPGRAVEERFGCPGKLCDRVATTEPAGPLPRCALTGRYMKLRTD